MTLLETCNQERFGQEENRKSIREKYESVCHNVHVDCKFIQVHIYSYTSPAIDTRVYPTYHPELKAEEDGWMDGWMELHVQKDTFSLTMCYLSTSLFVCPSTRINDFSLLI